MRSVHDRLLWEADMNKLENAFSLQQHITHSTVILLLHEADMLLPCFYSKMRPVSIRISHWTDMNRVKNALSSHLNNIEAEEFQSRPGPHHLPKQVTCMSASGLGFKTLSACLNINQHSFSPKPHSESEVGRLPSLLVCLPTPYTLCYTLPSMSSTT